MSQIWYNISMRLKQDDGDTVWKQYLYHCLKLIGKDLEHCELCGKAMKKPHIHHTKYDDATLYDLVIACQRCNTQPHNRFLI